MVTIDLNTCTGCGGCIDLCPALAINMINDEVIIDHEICMECGICTKLCPVNAPREVKPS